MSGFFVKNAAEFDQLGKQVAAKMLHTYDINILEHIGLNLEGSTSPGRSMFALVAQRLDISLFQRPDLLPHRVDYYRSKHWPDVL